jgi:hypothetical protein
MNKDNSRKVEQTERFSIDEELHSLDKEELFYLHGRSATTVKL